MRRTTALAAVGLLAALLAGCGGSKDSDTYVLDLHGAAKVTAPGPVRHLSAGRHRLAVGQTVTITDGRAVLGLPGDTSLELRHGRLDSTVRADRATDRLAVGTRDRRFAGGIHLGHDQSIDVRQHASEVIEQVARARISMRLECEQDATA